MNYDVSYFIKKFEAIPEELWCIWEQTDENYNHCALGWCGISDISKYKRWVNSINWNPEATQLQLILNDMTAQINNGYHEKYQQSTPKQRILAALYDIKKIQDGDPQNKSITTTQTFKEITFEKIKEDINVPQSVN